MPRDRYVRGGSSESGNERDDDVRRRLAVDDRQHDPPRGDGVRLGESRRLLFRKPRLFQRSSFDDRDAAGYYAGLSTDTAVHGSQARPEEPDTVRVVEFQDQGVARDRSRYDLPHPEETSPPRSGIQVSVAAGA